MVDNLSAFEAEVGAMPASSASNPSMAALAIPSELLVAIVRTHTTASLLVKLLCVCQTWRAALLAAGDRVWEGLAYERFPRLRLILRHTDALHPFRILYRQQLAAECWPEPPEPPPPPPLTEYIFTVEWKTGDGLLATWSGSTTDHEAWLPVEWSGPPEQLERLDRLRRALRSYFAETRQLMAGNWAENEEDWTELYHELLGSEEYEIAVRFSVTLSVTRRSDLATVVLVDQGDVEVADPNDENDVQSEVDRRYCRRRVRPSPPRCQISTVEWLAPAIAPTYGVLDEWHEQERMLRTENIPGDFHMSIRIRPELWINSRELGGNENSRDEVCLGFGKKQLLPPFPAVPPFTAKPNLEGRRDLMELPPKELLRYLAHHAPWPSV